MTVYLDHAADGPLHPDAAAAVARWSYGLTGNPSGSHAVARRARQAVDEARDAVAAFCGFDPSGVVFTSGGTESDNLGVLGPLADLPGAVVVSAVEHPAVIEAAAASGREVRVAPVDTEGLIDRRGLAALLHGEVAVVSVQLVNHETGVIQDLAAISSVVRRRCPAAVIHTDAVQAAPWLNLATLCAPADLVSVSGHKMGGPQGSGFLAHRPHVRVAPLIHGGGQEAERRSGTQNVAAIAGLGAAAAALTRDGSAGERVGNLRTVMEEALLSSIPGIAVSSAAAPRAPGHLHVRIPGADSESMLFLLDEAGICASAGAACASGALEPSPVLLAMGVDKEEAACALRLTLGPTTDRDAIDEAVAAIVEAAGRLR